MVYNNAASSIPIKYKKNSNRSIWPIDGTLQVPPHLVIVDLGVIEKKKGSLKLKKERIDRF